MDAGLQRQTRGELDAAHGHRCLVRRAELPGVSERLFPERSRLVDVMHDAEFLRFFKSQRAASCDDLHSLRVADEAGQTLRAADAGFQAQVNLGQAETP